MTAPTNTASGVAGEVAEWARDRATDLICQEEVLHLGEASAVTIGRAFARFIQEVSDAAKECEGALAAQGFTKLIAFILPEPVDPLLIEARQVVIDKLGLIGTTAKNTLDGVYDEGSVRSNQVELAYRALRRGIELAQVHP